MWKKLIQMIKYKENSKCPRMSLLKNNWFYSNISRLGSYEVGKYNENQNN